MSQTEFFQLSIILMVGIFHVNRFIGAFLIYCCFQTVILTELNVESRILTNIFFGAVLYQSVVIFCNTSDIRRYMWVFFALLAFNILWVPLQMTGNDFVWSMLNIDKQQVMSEFPGWFSLPAFLGNYSAVVLPLCLSLWWPLAAFAFLGIWFSKSTFSAIAAIFGVLFYLWFKKRVYFWGALIVLSICASYYVRTDFESGQFGRRLGVWKVIAAQASKNQFFGHGIGAYGRRFMFVETTPSHKYHMARGPADILKIAHNDAATKGNAELVEFTKKMLTENDYNFFKLSRKFQTHGMDIMIWNEAHNEVLQVFFNYGLIGVILIFMYLFDLLKRFYLFASKHEYSICFTASLVAIFIVSIGHFPLHVARLAGPFIAMLALLDMCLIRHKKMKDAII